MYILEKIVVFLYALFIHFYTLFENLSYLFIYLFNCIQILRNIVQFCKPRS